MEKRRIFVGKEYEKPFNSIISLINGNCFGDLPYSVSNGIICDGVYEYQLSAENSKTEQVKFAFENDGATWFKALRGEKVSDDDATWNTFISNAILEYHKRFSLVEYKKQQTTKEDEEKAYNKVKNCMSFICEKFYPEFKDKMSIFPSKEQNKIEDIYGVALKMELSGGTGASVPVLGKVYFVRTGKTLSPVLSSVVKTLDDTINAVIPQDDGQSESKNIDSRVIDNTLDAMQNLIESGTNNFADYLCFSEAEDLEMVNGLLEKLSHDDIQLECQRVDVLYITHIQTVAFEYLASMFDKVAFRFQLGMGDSFTMICEGCDQKEALIDRSQIVYFEDDVKKIASLNLNEENFGLDDDTIEKIKAGGDFANHLVFAPCKSVNKDVSCKAYKCKSQTLQSTFKGETVNYCKDCPFPEVVYTNADGEKYYTKHLCFVADKLELVMPTEQYETEKCSCCGRTFSKDKIKNGKCPTCINTLSSVSDKAKSLYKKYKDYLPLSVRIHKGKKACYEDEEIILFVVGNNAFIFNKLNYKENGYIDKPKTVR